MWTEHMNNLRLFNNGKYNKENLERYDLPIEEPNGLNAIYVPQNKGRGLNTPYQRQSFDPSLVGLPNHTLNSQDQKIHVDFVPNSPYEFTPDDKPVSITDYPLTSTAVTFLQGHLPLTKTRPRRRRRSLSSSDSESELSAADSSDVEDEITSGTHQTSDDNTAAVEPTPEPDDPDQGQGEPGKPSTSKGGKGGGRQGRRPGLRNIPRKNYTEFPDYTSSQSDSAPGEAGIEIRRKTRLGQSLDRFHTRAPPNDAPTTPYTADLTTPAAQAANVYTRPLQPLPPGPTPHAYIDQYGIDYTPILTRPSTSSASDETTPLLTPKKKKDYMARFLPRMYDTRAAAEKRKREEEEESVWAGASAPPIEGSASPHEHHTRYQAQKKKKSDSK